MKRITVYILAEQYTKIAKEAKKLKVGFAELLRKIIEDYFVK